MKVKRFLITSAFLIMLCLVFEPGCKYDVTEPQWDKPFTNPPQPKITRISPSGEAVPGVNRITIEGENFSSEPGGNSVQFDKLYAEIISSSSTSITVRRPNLVTDSGVVKIISSAALSAVTTGPYKIKPVIEQYGSFLDNIILSTVAADNLENLYVIESSSRIIYKITQEGQKTNFATAGRPVYGARIGAGNRLILMENNRSIEQIDLQTNASSEWVRLPQGKTVKYGDFDENGYFYAGGTRTGMVAVAPDLTTTSFPAAGYYGANDDILDMRVYNYSLYTLVSNVDPTTHDTTVVIWSHTIGANGNLGPKVSFIDLGTTSFANRSFKSIVFSSNGKLYIGTDNTDPLLIYDISSGNFDYFYKSIVPANIKQMYWGSGNNLYIISGDTNLGVAWTVYKIDMGITGSPYFGN